MWVTFLPTAEELLAQHIRLQQKLAIKYRLRKEPPSKVGEDPIGTRFGKESTWLRKDTQGRIADPWMRGATTVMPDAWFANERAQKRPPRTERDEYTPCTSPGRSRQACGATRTATKPSRSDRAGNEGNKRACEQAGKLAAVGGGGSRRSELRGGRRRPERARDGAQPPPVPGAVGCKPRRLPCHAALQVPSRRRALPSGGPLVPEHEDLLRMRRTPERPVERAHLPVRLRACSGPRHQRRTESCEPRRRELPGDGKRTRRACQSGVACNAQ